MLLGSTAIGVLVNAALALPLARAFGVPGIALAATLMHVAAFMILALMVRRRLVFAAMPAA
jgi:hypothetical protein